MPVGIDEKDEVAKDQLTGLDFHFGASRESKMFALKSNPCRTNAHTADSTNPNSSNTILFDQDFALQMGVAQEIIRQNHDVLERLD